MIQDVLTYLLIASATGYILFSIYRMMYPAKNAQAAGCPGCSGCSHDIAPVKNDISVKSTTKISPLRSYSSNSGSVPASGANTTWVPRDFASSDLEDRLQ